MRQDISFRLPNSPLILFVAAMLVSLTGLTLFAFLIPLTADSMRGIGARPFDGIDLVHFASNAFYRWRIDPFLLAGALAVESVTRLPLAQALAVFSLAIFSGGLARHHYEQHSTSSFVSIIIRSTLPSLVLLALFGAHTAIVTSIAYLPLLVLALSRLANRVSLLRAGALVTLLIAAAWSANQLAPVVVTLAIIFGAGVQWRPWMVLLLCPAILAAHFAEAPSFPPYPQEAHVVPLSPPLSRALPLLGADSPLPVIDRVHYKAQLFPLCVALFGCVVAGVRFRDSASRQMNVAALLSAFAVAWETCSRTTPLLRYGPLNELARLVPNGALLEPWGPAIALTVVSLAFSRSLRIRVTLLFGVASIVAAAFLGRPLSQSVADQGPFNEWKGLPGSRARMIEPLLFSPSYFVAKEWGLRIFEEWGDGRPVGLQADVASLRASHNERFLSNLVDGNPATRWSPERGGQFGDEAIRICLTRPIRTTSIELVADGFATDFPRGLRLCSFQSETPPSEKQTETSLSSCASGELIFETRDWQGAVAMTDSGHPYFRAQHVVVLPTFQHAQKQCFQVEQTAIAKGFDWSVAEIRLGVADEPQQL